MKKILIVVGTRPNFIKVTRFKQVLAQYADKVQLKIVHTGQHYDDQMSGVFLKQFGLEPDFFLNIGKGSPNTQTAEIMLRLEKIFKDVFSPDLVIVPGDVNSTLAAALATHKSGIALAHLESGLRSFDRTMPEEINRLITDELSDWFYITEQSGTDNLSREGKSPEKMVFAGNTMIDTLVSFAKEIENENVLSALNLSPGKYALMTMHRPATVDFREGLEKLIVVIKEICRDQKLVFPLHPRTKDKLKEFGLMSTLSSLPNLIMSEPMSYFSFQKLTANAGVIVTDSGGIQEESTFYGVPCLTLRPNTERPVTVTMGTNILIEPDPALIMQHISDIRAGNFKKGAIPPLWDGHATERIVEHLLSVL